MNQAQHLGELLLRIDTLEELLGISGSQQQVDPATQAELRGAQEELTRKGQVIADLNARALRAEHQLAAALAQLQEKDRCITDLELQLRSALAGNGAVKLRREAGYSHYTPRAAPRKVLDLLSGRDDWITFPEIRLALPDIPAENLSYAVHVLFQKHLVERRGERMRYTFRVKRPAQSSSNNEQGTA